ncbi:MAG: Na+/H+ antiporter NhaA [Pseudomonadota bacterium]
MKTKLQGALAFIRHEAAAGSLLLLAALLALALQNSAGAWLYNSLLETRVMIAVGALKLDKPLLLWINDGLMAIFFFLVGLEIKRELLVGELSTARQAALPAIAAVGGMVVPALVYAAVNWGSPETLGGWAIPAATDIAFALGVLALLGPRVPVALKVFLLALAIIDDLGAIVIIAIFFTTDLSVTALSLAAVGLVALVALNRLGVTRIAAFVLVGLFIWACVLKSGVHATLAGVATALAVPLHGPEGDHEDGPVAVLEESLHPWVTYLILPAFAFANAGVSLAGVSLAKLLGPVPLGIAAGLFVGKPIGIFGSTWLAVRLGLAERPPATSWPELLGVAWLGGIGFTMSLFIGMLAFPDSTLATDIRIGVLGGSLLSALAGYMVLSGALSRRPASAPVA